MDSRNHPVQFPLLNFHQKPIIHREQVPDFLPLLTGGNQSQVVITFPLFQCSVNCWTKFAKFYCAKIRSDTTCQWTSISSMRNSGRSSSATVFWHLQFPREVHQNFSDYLIWPQYSDILVLQKLKAVLTVCVKKTFLSNRMHAVRRYYLRFF